MRSIRFRSIVFACLFGSLLLPSRLLAEDAPVLRGCLGAPVVGCIEAIKPFLSEVEYRLALKGIDAYRAGDINGTRRKTGIATLSYHSKFAELGEPNQLLILTYSQNLTIQEIRIFLRHSPMAADTAAEYERTRLYEAAIFALGPQASCAKMENPHSFYLYFHNEIKNSTKILSEGKHTRDHPSGNAVIASTGNAPLCGHSMQLVSSGQEETSERRRLSENHSSEVTTTQLKYGLNTQYREVDKVYTGGDYGLLGSSVIFK